MTVKHYELHAVTREPFLIPPDTRSDRVQCPLKVDREAPLEFRIWTQRCIWYNHIFCSLLCPLWKNQQGINVKVGSFMRSLIQV